jgi:hypothetical protein
MARPPGTPAGGERISLSPECTSPLGGAQDIDAFAGYLAAGATGVAVPALTRITSLP